MYEGTRENAWKIIWHIRYCRAFLKYGLNDLESRMIKLEKEFSELKNECEQYKFFRKFDNLKHIVDDLQEIAKHENENVKRIAIKILNDLLEKK